MHWHIYWGPAVDEAMGAVVYSTRVKASLVAALQRAGESPEVGRCKDKECRARPYRG